MPAANSTFAIGGVSYSADNFVFKESTVLRINIYGGSPPITNLQTVVCNKPTDITPTKMTKPEFDRIMNTIVKDCLIVTFIVGFGLILYGTYEESGDRNAGSMYGLYLIPLIPVILIALGMIQYIRKRLDSKTNWMSLLSPLILLTLTALLNNFEAYLLAVVLLLIIVYSITKKVFRQLTL